MSSSLAASICSGVEPMMKWPAGINRITEPSRTLVQDCIRASRPAGRCGSVSPHAVLRLFRLIKRLCWSLCFAVFVWAVCNGHSASQQSGTPEIALCQASPSSWDPAARYQPEHNFESEPSGQGIVRKTIPKTGEVSLSTWRQSRNHRQ